MEEKDEKPGVRNISICWHSVPPPLHDRPSSPFEGDLQFGETITVAYVQEGAVRPPARLSALLPYGRSATNGRSSSRSTCRREGKRRALPQQPLLSRPSDDGENKERSCRRRCCPLLLSGGISGGGGGVPCD